MAPFVWRRLLRVSISEARIPVAAVVEPTRQSRGGEPGNPAINGGSEMLWPGQLSQCSDHACHLGRASDQWQTNDVENTSRKSSASVVEAMNEPHVTNSNSLPDSSQYVSPIVP